VSRIRLIAVVTKDSTGTYGLYLVHVGISSLGIHEMFNLLFV